MSIIEKALAKQQQKNTQNTGTSDQTSGQQQVKNNIADVAPKTALTLDKKSLSERGYLIDNGTRHSIKDEFRQIKRKLLNNAFGNAAKTLHHSNLIMVSSAKPNEGKTFVAINLALSIALEQDKTVLLIDADVLRPSVVRELGVQENPGIIDYLLGDSEQVSDIIYDTDIDKLKLIPAGKPHHLSNELLASEKMATFANELANRYPDRIVIFDCPPLIGATETLVLANLMGQALIVVEESKTTIADIQAATEHLNENLALGLVLNKAIRSHKDLYGYYGYGYGTKD
ncbi:XrtA-associated tyrosine autokinase [Cognaticolwellia beringensis]|uniref:non-specific protein-tyrosine kinase n=1 Tax=Cognaticolwellia beringensis TaxID=1967665 RepID=A0A222G7U9_9GAMM|nr:XrtA-associated tyrosine autokinase [Cognaticolwellia beringensis]ASP47965.1 exopolysaccharide biosynthesis protein [Cognaticolwellia beringensis]